MEETAHGEKTIPENKSPEQMTEVEQEDNKDKPVEMESEENSNTIPDITPKGNEVKKGADKDVPGQDVASLSAENTEDVETADGEDAPNKSEEKEDADEVKNRPPKKAKPAKSSAPVPVSVPMESLEDNLSTSLYGRKRKAVERIVSPDSFRTEDPIIVQGKGIPLKDIGDVESNMKKLAKTSPLLKSLHLLAFNKVPKQATVKQNLLTFSGVIFTAGEEEHNRSKLVEKCNKLNLQMLKDLLDLLEVPRGKSALGDDIKKDSLAKLLASFLEVPNEQSGKKPKTPRRSTSKTPKKSSSKKKRSSSSKKKVSSSAKKTSSENGHKAKTPAKKVTAQNSDTDSDESDHKAKKRAKKAKAHHSDTDSEEDTKLTSLPGVASHLESKKSKKDDEFSDLSSDSEEEVHVTDDQLKNKMKELLADADIEQLTVKKIRAALEEHFGVDLHDRKNRIKEMIEEVIQEK